jgi:hypothetical protein
MKTEFMPSPPKNWRDLEPHELSSISDFGAGIDQDAAIAFMRINGYDDNEPIITFEGKILDGRHKKFWAIESGCTPTFKRFVGTYDEAKALVLKKIHRQHLNTSQRATVAARLANLKRDTTDSKMGGKFTPKSESSNISDLTPQEEAAKIMNVSPSAVKQAAKVEANGVPELKDAVAQGDISVSDAAKASDEPPKVQQAAVKAVKTGKASTATAAVHQRKKKTGSPTFDDRPAEKLIGQLTRFFDARANTYGKGPKHSKCIEAMEKVLAAWQQWQAETNK